MRGSDALYRNRVGVTTRTNIVIERKFREVDRSVLSFHGTCGKLETDVKVASFKVHAGTQGTCTVTGNIIRFVHWIYGNCNGCR